MKLTSVAVRNAKPKEKPYKLSDGAGLTLLVQPTGKKWWRLRYRIHGKEKMISLGVFPEVSLAEAREMRDQARAQLSGGQDPATLKKKSVSAPPSANNFRAVAMEWYESRLNSWSTRYAENVLRRLELNIFPSLGARDVGDITAPALLEVLRTIEGRGALDMAQTVHQYCAKIFTYAIATGRAERNPAADLRGVLKTPARRHHSHLQESELPEFLQRLATYDGDVLTRLALELMLLTFVRTTELRGALWDEILFDKAEWHIPAERMKMKDKHIVPLSTQALAVLTELRALTGNRFAAHQPQFVFPNKQHPGRFMSENTMLYALYRMGYHKRATVHGIRSTASTILNECREKHGFHPDVIERQLAHMERNSVRRAYNHAEHLGERRQLMQWWADFLDQRRVAP